MSTSVITEDGLEPAVSEEEAEGDFFEDGNRQGSHAPPGAKQGSGSKVSWESLRNMLPNLVLAAQTCRVCGLHGWGCVLKGELLFGVQTK
ncbi:unnamed protein product [Lota lota]